MYEHQVIQDLLAMQNLPWEEKDGGLDQRDHMQFVIDGIKQSQRFHLGELTNPHKVLGLDMLHKELFIGPLAKWVKLPYQTSWFDYHVLWGDVDMGKVAVRKRGVLATMQEDLLLVYIVNYFPLFHPLLDNPEYTERLSYALEGRRFLWVISPIHYCISVGKMIGDSSLYPTIEKYYMSDGKTTAKKVKEILDTTNFVPMRSGRYRLRTEKEWLTAQQDDAMDLACLNAALIVLNCKNVGQEKVIPDIALNKKRVKTGKVPMFSYYTLVLKPVGKRQQSIPKHLWENRIHFQRGHFKVFPEESRLFGKIAGVFWWQPHLRGRNKRGVILKDYEVREGLK